MYGVKNLKPYTLDMKNRVGEERLLRREFYGRRLLILRLRRVPLICYIKMRVIGKVIKSIWELLSLGIILNKNEYFILFFNIHFIF